MKVYGWDKAEVTSETIVRTAERVVRSIRDEKTRRGTIDGKATSSRSFRETQRGQTPIGGN